MSNSNDRFAIKTIISIAATMFALGLWLNKHEGDLRNDCAAMGGVLLRDHTCIKAEILNPEDKK